VAVAMPAGRRSLRRRGGHYGGYGGHYGGYRGGGFYRGSTFYGRAGYFGGRYGGHLYLGPVGIWGRGAYWGPRLLLLGRRRVGLVRRAVVGFGGLPWLGLDGPAVGLERHRVVWQEGYWTTADLPQQTQGAPAEQQEEQATPTQQQETPAEGDEQQQ